jgi:hypothetical protein
VAAAFSKGMTRTIFIHWGLPRTGTTAFQKFLGENSTFLADQGVLYPRMGWLGSPHPAHHNIAWQLIGDPRFSPARGTIADLLAEVQQHDGNVLLSSEDFVMTPHHQGALAGFISQLRELAFQVVVVLVLRHQREFAHSLYAEMVGHQRLPMDFSDFLAQICSTSEFRYHFWLYPFDYQVYLRLLEPIVPEIRIIPYGSAAPRLRADFIASLLHICGIDTRGMPMPQVMNRSAFSWSLLRSHHRNYHGVITRSVDAVIDEARNLCPSIERFTPDEAELLDATFAASNAVVERAWQFQFNATEDAVQPARMLCTSDVFREEFHRLLVALADRDPISRLHRWIHAIVSRDARVA